MVKMSLIIITFNQHLQTKILLESLSKQQDVCFDDFEVIVVDDGSALAFATDKIYNFRLQIVRMANGGRAAARNCGVKKSNSNFIVFCDGDRIADTHFVKNYLDSICTDSLVVGEVREIYCRSNPNYDIVADLITKKRYRVPNYVYKTNVLYDSNGWTDSYIPWITTFSGNMGIDKNLLKKSGMFDEKFTNWGFEHFELGYRLCNKGIRFKKNRAINYHIAHARNIEQLQANIADSIQFFYKKHGDPIILKFYDFLEGLIPLQELEENQDAKWIKERTENIYVGVGRRGCP